MRIAQIAPLAESVPPRLYGGTERVVSWLTEELVRRGHEVTLFASADSATRARLVAGCPRALRLSRGARDPLAYEMRQLHEVFGRADRFDVLHFHVDYAHLPLAARHRTPFLTTLHGRLDMPDLPWIYDAFPHAPFVSISHAQRRPLGDLRWLATIHHGMPEDLLRPPAARPREPYLVFLGRLCADKGVLDAIAIARRCGLPLLMAAKIDRTDRAYFEAAVAPLVDGSRVRYLGEVDDAGKVELLGGALAMLFPIDWPEPFGLVLIEALACGTPVVAFARGSVPEIIDDGVTGFLAGDVAEAARAVARVERVDRAACRAAFEARFTDRLMAARYLEAYGAVLRREAA